MEHYPPIDVPAPCACVLGREVDALVDGDDEGAALEAIADGGVEAAEDPTASQRAALVQFQTAGRSTDDGFGVGGAVGELVGLGVHRAGVDGAFLGLKRRGCKG